jgi:osmotically-inducible protein OsmY
LNSHSIAGVYEDSWVNGVQWVDISGVEVVPDVRLAMKEGGLMTSTGLAAAERLTDAQLRKEVAGACNLDPLLKPGQVKVEVQKGVVILRGTAPSPNARDVAGEIAREVAGPGQVENLIAIRPIQGS